MQFAIIIGMCVQPANSVRVTCMGSADTIRSPLASEAEGADTWAGGGGGGAAQGHACTGVMAVASTLAVSAHMIPVADVLYARVRDRCLGRPFALYTFIL